MHPSQQISQWLHRFEQVLTEQRFEELPELFSDPCYWRDMLSFTWNIVTLEGVDAIEDMLRATSHSVTPQNWEIEGEVSEDAEGWACWLRFETRAGLGKGHIRLNEGKCFSLLTTLEHLADYPPAVGGLRELGVELTAAKGRQSHGQKLQIRSRKLGTEEQPYCVIIGGGQGGLALAARLKYLNVPTLIIEKNARIGDSWRNRYDSLCLHDPVWFDHMPYIPFPEGWPVFTSKDKMGDWLDMYATVLDIDCWTNANCRSANFDSENLSWNITVDRSGEERQLYPRHLVFATGMSGYPHIPEFEGQELFQGLQIHSSQYKTGSDFRGKRCVVIGSNTSAHDICMNLWEHDVEATMIQRSPTTVARAQTVLDCVLGSLYSEAALASGIDTTTADYTATTIPYRLLEQRQKQVCIEMRERDRDLHDQLIDAGFLLDFGEDETGMVLKSFRQAGGFYIDVGASKLICSGDIKLKAGREISRLQPDGVLLEDGETVPADIIIYATGYTSMNKFVADIVGKDMADKVGRCWGLGSGTQKDPGPWEGELRNMWKPTQQEGLWFQGGNLAQCRHYSRFLALQIKARFEQLATPVYNRAPVYHLS